MINFGKICLLFTIVELHIEIEMPQKIDNNNMYGLQLSTQSKLMHSEGGQLRQIYHLLNCNMHIP
jgi:hypothetical protein